MNFTTYAYQLMCPIYIHMICFRFSFLENLVDFLILNVDNKLLELVWSDYNV